MPDEQERDKFLEKSPPDSERAAALGNTALTETKWQEVKFEDFVLENSELLPLTAAVNEHNSHAGAKFENDCRFLVVDGPASLVIDGKKQELKPHTGGLIFKVLNTFFAHPDAVIRSKELSLISSSVYDAVSEINHYSGDDHPIIKKQRKSGGSYYRLSPDIILLEARVPGRPEPSKPKSPSPVRKPKPKPKPAPVKEELISQLLDVDVPDQPAAAETSVPKVHVLNPAESLNYAPVRFVVIGNLGSLNQMTQEGLRKLGGSMRANQVVILNDSRVKLISSNNTDGQSREWFYEVGPQPKFFLNKLIANYPTTWISVDELAISPYHGDVERAEIMSRDLAARKFVFRKVINGKTHVLLFPTIFHDNRPPLY